MMEVGPLATAGTARNIQEEIQEEVVFKFETLKQLLEEKRQYEESEKENKILRSEIETMEEEMKEEEKTAEELRKEAWDLMKTITDNREKRESKAPKLKEEKKELQVRLSNLRQAGPRGQYEKYEKPNFKFTTNSDNRPLQLPPTPASKFVFKRK